VIITGSRIINFPKLVGTAEAADVANGKTFYATNPYSLLTGTAAGTSSELPKTGQTNIVYAGDDGTYQAGSAVTPRFTDNADGTITDNATSLMWVKDGTGAGANGGLSNGWEAQIDFIEALTFADFSDWRMPNLKELISIVDYGQTSPAINTTYFTNTSLNDDYWTSTEDKTFLPIDEIAFAVSFIGGRANGRAITDNLYIRPVRGGTHL